MVHSLRPYLLFTICFLLLSCNQEEELYQKSKPSFERILGRKYTEVKRVFDTGISWDHRGYQLEPNWEMEFITKDTVKIYSPEIKKFMPYRIYFDHDSVINTAMVWLRVKSVSKDSLKLQVLRVNGKKISDKTSNLFMTLYANDFIRKNRLSVDKLRQPTMADSAYVRNKIDSINKKQIKFFGARNPVELISKSKAISVSKVQAKPDPLNKTDPADEYLYPQFNVVIDPAYNAFNFSFSVYVEPDGDITFNRSEIYIMPEFEETKVKIMKGIIDVYLKNLLRVTPGNTLGIKQRSLIQLNVRGIKH